MKISSFKTEPNPNGGLSIIFGGKFAGLYCEKRQDIIQATNAGQIFSEPLLVKFMRDRHPNKIIYTHVSSNGQGQLFLRVSTKRLITESGKVNQYKPKTIKQNEN